MGLLAVLFLGRRLEEGMSGRRVTEEEKDNLARLERKK